MPFVAAEIPRRPDYPDPGFYLIRLVARGPLVACEIIRRRERWGVAIDGRRPSYWNIDPWKVPRLEQVWLGERCDQAEYERRLALKLIPGHPAQTPGQPIDLAAAPTIKLS